jgi:single-strand DNA-binding protein
MSGSVNKCILVGNLGRDPEIRALNNGDKVASFSIATSETWRDKATGERKERTEWHNVVIFNENIVRVAEAYLRKGSKVYLEGQLQTRKYQDRDGHERSITEVVLQRFRGELTLLDGKPAGDDVPRAAASDARAYADKKAPARADLDDEIPF